MHNCNSSINNKSVQKEKVFYPQKCVQHQKQKKAVNALCRSHLHDFLIQRQYGSCSHTPPTWSQEQKQDGGEASTANTSCPPAWNNEKKLPGSWVVWVGVVLLLHWAQFHTGASSASSNTLLCCGVALTSPVPWQPPHPLCQFSTTVNLMLPLSAQRFVAAFWRKNRSRPAEEPNTEGLMLTLSQKEVKMSPFQKGRLSFPDETMPWLPPTMMCMV